MGAFILSSMLSGGCATLGRRGVEVPLHDKLYVAVFVDETERGEVGVVLADALQLELWRRDPESLVLFFEADTVALDGTVTSLSEAPVPGGDIELTVVASGRLVSRDRTLVADLGEVTSSARYRVVKDIESTEADRHEALSAAIDRMAKAFLDRVDEAGRAARRSAP